MKQSMTRKNKQQIKLAAFRLEKPNVQIWTAAEMRSCLHDLAAAAARIVEDDNKPTLEHMRELDRQRARASRILRIT